MKLEELKSNYNEDFIKESLNNTIEVDGTIYYYSEYSPRIIDNWELLSDLSELEHLEEDFDF